MLTLITGGSGSGKSAFAEGLLAADPGKRTYIACMIPSGREGAARVARHRQLRAGKGFTTVERYVDVGGLRLPEGGAALLECLCNLVANELFEDEGAHEKTFEAVVSGVLALEKQCKELFVVTNDVASGGNWNTDSGTARYVNTLGRVNAALAERAERVIELVCGIPILIKGEPL